eukprot:362589-Chlamydomonas_euryale.AAC.7
MHPSATAESGRIQAIGTACCHGWNALPCAMPTRRLQPHALPRALPRQQQQHQHQQHQRRHKWRQSRARGALPLVPGGLSVAQRSRAFVVHASGAMQKGWD